MHSTALAAGKQAHSQSALRWPACEERLRYAGGYAAFCSPSQFVVVQVTSSMYWARVSLLCSTFAAFQRISPTPFPNPPKRLEQEQLHVDVLVLPGVAILAAIGRTACGGGRPPPFSP